MLFCESNIPKKHRLGPQNGPGSSGPEKTTKNSKLSKLPKSHFEPFGKGGWPPISTWINHTHKLQIRGKKQNKLEPDHKYQEYEKTFQDLDQFSLLGADRQP
jgi:hypothetical protein